MKKHSKKGFTLVEIMIVVVIIGLLAAMAIPAFQRVRENAVEKGILNDGRQIGSAAQQYYLENGVVSVAVTIATDGTDNGDLSGGLTSYLNQITPDTVFGGSLNQTATFSLSRGGQTVNFDAEGKEQ